MEEKKSIKVSLGTTICIIIIVLLFSALGVVYYLGFIKNNQTINDLESEKVALENEKIELEKQVNTLQDINNKIKLELNDNENTTEEQTIEIKEDSSNISILSKSEIQSILGPDEATFCIENIEKSGQDYIITANMLNNEGRVLTEAEYNDLLNGKEIVFRNQKWKLNNSEENFVYIESGNDKLTVDKNTKLIGNVAGAKGELCDYSGQKIKFKVSKDILICEFWTYFKYDKNGQIKAYGIENEEIENFKSISFDRLLGLSEGCNGTYDECVAYVKNGEVGAIKIFNK